MVQILNLNGGENRKELIQFTLKSKSKMTKSAKCLKKQGI
jgi:hypothetical protein